MNPAPKSDFELLAGSREFAEAGTFYLRLSSTNPGGYTYHLEDLGPDDAGDTPR